jgi:TRAP-type C4-dicarboxylate transport system permease small subunit
MSEIPVTASDTHGGVRVVGLGPSALLDRLTGLVAVIGFFGLVAIAFLTFYDGLARSLRLPQLSGFRDYGEAIYPIVIASCFPAALLRGTNVTITFLGKALGKASNAWLEAFAALVTFGFFLVLAWQFVVFTSELGSRTSRTAVLTLEPFWWVVTAVTALCVPVQLWVALLKSYCAFTGRGVPPDEHSLRAYRER